MYHDVKVSFEALFNSASLGIIVDNEKGEIALANPFLLHQFSYQGRELIGGLVDRLIPYRFHNRYHQHMAEYNEHPQKRTTGLGMDLFWIKKNGSEFSVEVSLGKFEGEYGRFPISFVSDITGRKQAEKVLNDELEAKVAERTLSLRDTVNDLAKVVAETQVKDLEMSRVNSFLKNIWNHAKPIIYVTDEHGTIKMFNSTAEKQLGYKAAEMIGRASPIFFHEPREVSMRLMELGRLLNKEIKPDFSVLAAKAVQGFSNESELTFYEKTVHLFLFP